MENQLAKELSEMTDTTTSACHSPTTEKKKVLEEPTNQDSILNENCSNQVSNDPVIEAENSVTTPSTDQSNGEDTEPEESKSINSESKHRAQKCIKVVQQVKNRLLKRLENDVMPVDTACLAPLVSSLAQSDRTRVMQPSSFLVQQMSLRGLGGFEALFREQPADMKAMQKYFSEMFAEDFEQQLAVETSEGQEPKTTFGFFDVSTYVRLGIENIVQDSFSVCFESMPQEHWNWNVYLMPPYLLGVAVRYLFLLPVRVLMITIASTLVMLVHALTLLFKDDDWQLWGQELGLKMLAFAWLASWSSVIKYHGNPPPRRPGQIYVANHSSVLDIVPIYYHSPICVVGQIQPGVLGFLQNHVLRCMNNLMFNRLDKSDRSATAKKIEEHIRNPKHPPLLVFPEGTCVNNEYAVMFKQGVFDLDAEIVPIAIKYDRNYADAFWNSKRFSFPRHLFRLMTSWCVVADVWFLEPQRRQENETAIEFALRVKNMICAKASLVPVPWDGYLKYFRPSEKEKRARQDIFADVLCKRFGIQPQRQSTTTNA